MVLQVRRTIRVGRGGVVELRVDGHVELLHQVLRLRVLPRRIRELGEDGRAGVVLEDFEAPLPVLKSAQDSCSARSRSQLPCTGVREDVRPNRRRLRHLQLARRAARRRRDLHLLPGGELARVVVIHLVQRQRLRQRAARGQVQGQLLIRGHRRVVHHLDEVLEGDAELLGEALALLRGGGVLGEEALPVRGGGEVHLGSRWRSSA